MPKSQYIRTLFFLLLIIGSSEYALMMLFDTLHLEQDIHPSALAFLDALCLILVAAIPVHIWIIRPIIQCEKAHQRKRDMLLQALDEASDSVIVSNHQGHIIYVNRAFTNMSGYTPEDILGKNPRILQSGKHDKAFYRAMWHTIHTTGEWQGEVWNRHQNGSEYLETLHIKKITTDQHDKPYYIAITTDITDKKKQEERLAHTEKMAAIGTLVGGIAHNFNNLLSGIIGNAYLAQHDDNPPSTNQRLQLIERVSFDASEMVKSLLVFARNHAPKKKNIAIVPMLQHTIQTAKLGLSSDTQLNIQLPEENLMLYCDSIEIQQMLLNLITNARDALPESGERRIDIIIRKASWEECLHHEQCDTCSSHVLQIIVQDSGCGISDKDMPHIFEPFYTTKEVGKGTGLGLSTTFSTVQAHGGSIHIESEPGQGSRFEICLPLPFVTPSDEPDSIPVKPAPHDTTILIVDDELMVRNTLQQILESLGYRTITASHGQEAIEKVQSNETAVALVITDIVMPVLDGISAINVIRQTQPQLPVIFISGYEQKLNDIVTDAITYRIAKPFDIALLSQQAHTLLTPTRTKQPD